MDGIRGVYHGGPFAWERDKGKWCWEYNSLLLATDPVAMDHVEWDIVDAQRVQDEDGRRSEVLASSLSDPLGDEGFDVRQPQYIALAGALGMGHFDYKSPRGRRYSIQHKSRCRLRLTAAGTAPVLRFGRRPCYRFISWAGSKSAGSTSATCPLA